MVIRKQQIETFSNVLLASFKQRMEAHLDRCFPNECRELGVDGVRRMIRYGIERAGKYGIALERDVCKYIDLMFAFGPNFDSELPWPSAILNDGAITDPTTRTERLFEAARLHSWRPLA